jgi:hypothetical protein
MSPAKRKLNAMPSTPLIPHGNLIATVLYFLKKTIRVKDTVVRRDDRAYIDVSLGSQLDLAPVQNE